MIPEEPTIKLKAKLQNQKDKMKEESTNAGGNKTRRNRDSHRSMPAKTSTFNDSIGLDLTAKKITRPTVNAGLSSHAGAGANTER